MNEDTQNREYGVDDEELIAFPTVFRDDLFEDKIVVVSGAGSGLGKAIALLFGRLSAKLIICGRTEDKLQNTRDWLKTLGAQADIHTMTIRDPDQVGALVDDVWEKHGGMDTLVNNAGGQFPQPAIDVSVKGWNAVIDTNLNGTWYMMQAAARRWRDAGRPGNIVNIVADFWRGMPDISHTCAARAGISYLSKSLAVEWAPHRIRVNCVAPGCVETEGFNVYPQERAATFRYSNPMMRAGHVMDIAEAVAFLAGPSGRFVTGETFTVDGGQQLWGDVWAYEKPDYFKIPD